MVIYHTTQGKVVFTMFDYIYNMLNKIPEGFSGIALTPACNHIIVKNYNHTKVVPQGQEIFHRHVARLLYLSNRSRPGIQTDVYYLCTRVHNTDIDDMKTNNTDNEISVTYTLDTPHIGIR